MPGPHPVARLARMGVRRDVPRGVVRRLRRVGGPLQLCRRIPVGACDRPLDADVRGMDERSREVVGPRPRVDDCRRRHAPLALATTPWWWLVGWVLGTAVS